MPGYFLVQTDGFKPARADGLDPHPVRIGFLDYLRELKQESFPFPKGHKLRVEGIEQVLLASDSNLQEIESAIHSVLSSRAGELEQRAILVQIVFDSDLSKADDFWFKVGGRRVTLKWLFNPGSVKQWGDGIYFIPFNLT